MIEWIKYKLTGELTTKMKLDVANKTVRDLMAELSRINCDYNTEHANLFVAKMELREKSYLLSDEASRVASLRRILVEMKDKYQTAIKVSKRQAESKAILRRRLKSKDKMLADMALRLSSMKDERDDLKRKVDSFTKVYISKQS